MSKEAMKLALEAFESLKVTVSNRTEANVIDGVDLFPKQMAALQKALANEALGKMAENARELGLDYEPAQPKYRRGDRLICLETEEYCVIHISGTDRQWVKFPDTHIGVYKNEQLAELFELLPKEIEIEQPAQQETVATVESVATVVSESGNPNVLMSWWHEPALPVGTKLYTSPHRTWVGLSDEEKSDIWCVVTNRDFVTEDTHVYADAIEAKLRSKNEDRN